VGVSAFRVLGPVEAWSDEGRLALGGPRQVKLLAFLLLNANRAVSGDAVIDAVWGTERDGAAKRLQMAVVRLRRALEPLDGQDAPRLRTVSGGYLLAVAPGDLDTELFGERVRAGRRALEVSEPARASALQTEALDLWRGPPLPRSRSTISLRARSAASRSYTSGHSRPECRPTSSSGAPPS
jgi:DNA-binding SARP family transcriptional activator